MSEARGFDGGVWFLRLRVGVERFRESLFFLPAILVAVGAVAGFVTLAFDRTYGGQSSELLGLSVSPESSRAILATVAGGTIGAISVVFSLTLVAIQLAASQFSPRVIRGILGDQVQQVILGTVVGTFTFALVALQGLQTSDAPTLPLSVYLAMVMGVVSLLAVLASIDRTARSLEVGSIIERITSETLAVIEAQPYVTDAAVLLDEAPTPLHPDQAPPDALRVEARRRGWVDQISVQGVLDALPAGATAQIGVDLGTYAQAGTLLVEVWPVPTREVPRVLRELHQAFGLEAHRSLQQDVGFGILLLVDIAQRALSPGVNDPNTAIEVIARLGSILTALGERSPGPPVLERDGRTVWLHRVETLADRLQQAIDPIHRYARNEPAVLEAIVRTLVETRGRLARRPGTNPEAVLVTLDRLREELPALESAADRHRIQRLLDAVDAGQ